MISENTNLSRIIIKILIFLSLLQYINPLMRYIFSFIHEPFMIKRPHYFVSGSSSLQAITLLISVTLGLVEVKI